ncbi:MAG: ABC transporter ATP-binding protein [Thermacetogeniaceae bacterium]
MLDSLDLSSAPGADLAIEVAGLCKSYGAVRAVDGLSFSVPAGEIFGMLGPNGAGKSTTVEILIGLRQRDGGEVRVLGRDPKRHPTAIKRRIGVQLQITALYPRLTVKETVRLFASFFPKTLPIAEAIARVGLEEKADDRVDRLSGGQAQRLSVALAMINDGDIIFLDEPTTGLDPQARRSLWDVILELKEAGKTVFLTTHYMDEAERLCDRVAVVDHGQIIAMGSPAKLIRDNFHEQALEFNQPALGNHVDLQTLPGVIRMQQEGESTTLYTDQAPRTIAALMEASANANLPVSDMTVRQATLEDVFLKLTGRRIRE